jgi:putative ABC transport system permease protein
LLGGPTLLAAVGAAAGVLMASSFREREDALLDVAGAEGSVRTLTAAWEALIYVATAAIMAATTAAVVAFGLTLFLAPLAPTLSPQLVPLLGLVGAVVCVVLAWVATFAPRLSRSGSTIEVLSGP